MLNLQPEYLSWLAISALVLNIVQLFLYYGCVRRLNLERLKSEQLGVQLQRALQAGAPAAAPTAKKNTRPHPLWAVVHIAALVGALWLVLSFTATDFDATEVKAILSYLVFAVAATQLGPDAFRLFGKSA